MYQSYGEQFEFFVSDKRDLSSYFKTQLDLRNEQVAELNDRLIGLQQVKEYEKDTFEKSLQNLKERYCLQIKDLENENQLLKTRLIAVEEFEYQRQTMEKTINELKNLILEKEDAFTKALDHIEIALVFFKNRLKNEAIEYLNELAIEFHQNTNSQIANTITRAIHENFYLTNQIHYLANRLENTITINKKHNEDKPYLKRTIAILEDVEAQSAKRYLTTRNIIRMLCEKLNQYEQEKNINNEVLVTSEMLKQKPQV